MSPRGRRPAGEDTRGLIVEAARAEFAAHGYDKASLRGIARAAGVDARLIHHYFEGKSALFAAILQVPVDPASLVAGLAADTAPEELGPRVVATFLSVWDAPENGEAIRALIRSALADDARLGMVREFVAGDIVGRIVGAHPVAGALAPRERRLRAGLIASQMMGLAVGRYVASFPGVADAPANVLVERVGAVIQGYLEQP